MNGIKNKRYLMLCEIHYPTFHGKTADSDPNIETHFLVYDRFDPITKISYTCLNDDYDYETDTEYESDDEYENNNRIIKMEDSIEFLKTHYSQFTNNNSLTHYSNHPSIRNFHNIVSKPNYIKAEIGEYIILPTQEAIAILKTFWLRIIQRKWKKVFKEREEIIISRRYVYSLYVREVTGKWPQICAYLPGLRGMLYELR